MTARVNAIFLVESVSAWLVLVYMVWVIGYDIPWAYTLWRLNPPERERVKREKTQLEKEE